MSAFPPIDTPCPLDADAQRAIDGHCSHCDRHVHRLDGMSACERRALFASATGPICVSYRVPAPRRVGRIGAVIAATLITSAVQASDPVPAHAPVPQSSTSTVAQAMQSIETELAAGDDEREETMVLGGIRAPQALIDMDPDMRIDAGGGEDIPALPVRSDGEEATKTDATTTASTPSSQARR